jgi:hypothetical protein
MNELDHWWDDDTDRWKLTYKVPNLSSANSSTTNPIQPGLGLNPGLRNERQTINPRSQATAFLYSIFLLMY